MTSSSARRKAGPGYPAAATPSAPPAGVPETPGERIPEGLAGNLAAQLPHEIGEHLRRTEIYTGAGTGERFGRQDVIARVSERAGVDEPQAATSSGP